MNTCACGCGQMARATFVKNHHRRRPVAERLWDKVERTESCWLWRGAVGSVGYGRIGSGVGKGTAQVHRVAYEAVKGPIPDGLHIDHLCGVKVCVNPDHLEAVTQGENNRRMWARGGRR